MIASKRVRMLEEEVDHQFTKVYAKIKGMAFHCDQCRQHAQTSIDRLRGVKDAGSAIFKIDGAKFGEALSMLESCKTTLDFILKALELPNPVEHIQLEDKPEDDDSGDLLN